MQLAGSEAGGSRTHLSTMCVVAGRPLLVPVQLQAWQACYSCMYSRMLKHTWQYYRYLVLGDVNV